MGINPLDEFDCVSCKYSHEVAGTLFCWLHSREAKNPCSVWQYEPGTDHTEQKAE